MAKYKILIEITNAVQQGDKIRIDSPIGIELFWFEFFDANSVDNENVPVEIGNTTTSTIYNLYTAFQANYNQQGFYTAITYGEILEIVGDFNSEPVLGSILPVGTNFTVTLENPDLLIVSTTHQVNSTDPCGFIDVLTTANHDFVKLLRPYTANFPATISYLIENIPRGAGDTFVIEIEDSNGKIARKTYPAISYLNEGVIDLQTVNNSLIITNYANSLEPLQYSLNGTDWQTENVFDNLQSGDYTLYIKDQYGCQITMLFTIITGEDGTTIIPEPYFKYSNANSIRMAKRQAWDGCSVQKNSTNTLSCEVIDQVKHTQYHYYLDCDVLKLQFKNNYADLKVVTSDDGLSQILTQKSNNIGIKSSMDCRITDLGNNQFGIYFISGDTYDYDTGANLNVPYVLNGELPQFGKLGNIITINNINYTISDVNYNETLKVEQLVIASTQLIENPNSVVKAIYNIYGYEIFEVSIAMNGRSLFNVQVFYDGQDEPKYVSELIKVVENNDNLMLLTWYMNYNTDMFYATGIIPSVRIFIDTIKAGTKNESESYETDSDSILIDSDNYEVDILKFEPQTKEVAKALVLWLSSQEFTARGIGYRKDAIEMEPLEVSNLYVVTATMVLRGTGTYEDRIGSSNVELIELIKTDADAFIKIR